MNKHTQYFDEPWRIADDIKSENYVIKNRSGLSVAVCGYKEHAQHIVRAVNAHEELLEALKEARAFVHDYANDDGILAEKIDEAVKKAEALL